MPLLGSRMPDYPQGGGNGAKRLRKRAASTTPIGADLQELKDELVQTIAMVLAAGGAIHLGMTSDGGALLIRAWIGGDKYEDYVTASVELVETLEALQGETQGAMARGEPKGPKARRNGS